jgi:hypothetical protein
MKWLRREYFDWHVCRLNTRRGLSFRAPSIFALSVVAALAMPQKSEGAMDRSVEVLAAYVFDYATYLYLSELFGKPTASRMYEKFCGDTMSDEQIRALKKDIKSIIERDVWNLDCAPLIPIVRKNKDGTFDLQMRYLKLMQSNDWLEKFKSAVVSPALGAELSVPSDRQLELSRLYKMPMHNDMQFNLFQRYQNKNYIRGMLTELKKISKMVTESKNEELLGQITFSSP